MKRVVGIEMKVCGLVAVLIFAIAELVHATVGVFYLLCIVGIWAATKFLLHPESLGDNRFARWLRR
jgi:hypothetical protein